LHPPQHLKDQLLLNGKNNLVLRQVALAMMQPTHNSMPAGGSVGSPANSAVNAAALLAAVQQQKQQQQQPNAQYATYATTNPPGATNSANGATSQSAQLLSAATLSNATLVCHHFFVLFLFPSLFQK
jgi:hypothetical protein